MNDVMVLQDVWGNKVALTMERLRHIEEHPEMSSFLEDIRNPLIATIREPDVVARSNIDASIRLYYCFFENTSLGNKYFCVVVKYTEKRNFIVTAYFTDKLKRGEILWTK